MFLNYEKCLRKDEKNQQIFPINVAHFVHFRPLTHFVYLIKRRIPKKIWNYFLDISM